MHYLYLLIRRFHIALLGMLAKPYINPGLLKVSSEQPRSPIFALETDHPRRLAKECQENGFVVRAVVPPTVPTRRVRVCLHAGNTAEEVDQLVERIEKWILSETRAFNQPRI